MNLDFFPPLRDMSAEELAKSLNPFLDCVSPRAFVGEDGRLENGWRCRNLWEAMWVMLYLDLIGDNTIRKCESRGPGLLVGAQDLLLVMAKFCCLKI